MLVSHIALSYLTDDYVRKKKKNPTEVEKKRRNINKQHVHVSRTQQNRFIRFFVDPEEANNNQNIVHTVGNSRAFAPY
jgi:hypothetical protein